MFEKSSVEFVCATGARIYSFLTHNPECVARVATWYPGQYAKYNKGANPNTDGVSHVTGVEIWEIWKSERDYRYTALTEDQMVEWRDLITSLQTNISIAVNRQPDHPPHAIFQFSMGLFLRACNVVGQYKAVVRLLKPTPTSNVVVEGIFEDAQTLVVSTKNTVECKLYISDDKSTVFRFDGQLATPTETEDRLRRANRLVAEVERLESHLANIKTLVLTVDPYTFDGIVDGLEVATRTVATEGIRWFAEKYCNETYVPEERLADAKMVTSFSQAMLRKMIASGETKHRSGWASEPGQHINALLKDQLKKGDPVDVANFAGMLFSKGEKIDLPN